MAENPFADPSQKRTQQNATVRTDTLDSYNPFGGQQTAGGGNQPAVLPPSASNGSSGGTTQPSSGAAIAELERRQRELDSKAAELDRREREQKNLLEQNKSERLNNFPPIPNFCPFKPCFYQDIDVEIPVEFRWIVKMGFYLWLAHATVLLLNILGSLSWFIGSQFSYEAGSTFCLSLIMTAFFIPLSYIFWFRPLYKAFRNDSSFNFFLFFFIFFIQFVIVLLQCFGINYFAACGWINGLSMIKLNPVVGGIMLIIAALFTVLAICDMMLLIRVHRLYRGTGASFEKARAEFNEGVVSNSVVRGAAAEAGSAAVRGTLRGSQ